MEAKSNWTRRYAPAAKVDKLDAALRAGYPHSNWTNWTSRNPADVKLDKTHALEANVWPRRHL